MDFSLVNSLTIQSVSRPQDHERPARSLPDEIMAEIFEFSRPAMAEATSNADEDVLHPSISRALVPFRLGAVCRRWREITVTESTLWNYIAVPTLDNITYGSRAARLLEYIQLALIRSRSVPIDIVFGFLEDADRDHYSLLIAALERARSRWRILAATFSGFGAAASLLGALHHSTPMLRTLQLAYQVSRHASSVMAHDSLVENENTLPDATQLQHLVLANVVISVPMSTRLHTYWLSRWLLAGSSFWPTLSAMPNLRSLTIWTDYVLEGTQPGQPIMLEHLHTLQLMFGADHLGHALCGCLKMPNLSTLVQRAGDLRYTAPLFRQYADSLRTLHLQNRVLITDDGVDALLQLRAVHSVGFTLCPVPRLLFECLVWRHGTASVLWPRLEVLMLDGPVIEAGDAQPLVLFARERAHTDGPQDQDGRPLWSRLEIRWSERTRLPEADLEQLRSSRIAPAV